MRGKQVMEEFFWYRKLYEVETFCRKHLWQETFCGGNVFMETFALRNVFWKCFGKICVKRKFCSGTVLGNISGTKVL